MHVLLCEVHVHVGVSMWEHVCMHVHACAYYERVGVMCVCLEGNRDYLTLRLPMLAWTTFILLKRR